MADHPMPCYPHMAHDAAGRPAFAEADRIDIPCGACGHLGFLHSSHRGCAGCEAIVAAASSAADMVQALMGPSGLGPVIGG